MDSSAATAAGINDSMPATATLSSLVAHVSASMSVPTPLSISAAPAAPPTIIPLSNTQHVINLKLTNTNYLFWRMQMKPYLIGQGVFSFVDGSTMCPSPHSDVSVTSPAFSCGFPLPS